MVRLECRTSLKAVGLRMSNERQPVPRLRQCRPPLELMDGLCYSTIIEPVEPLARPSRRSRAKTHRRGHLLIVRLHQGL